MILPTVRNPMVGNDGMMHCRALVDQGSQRSFISQDTLANLHHTVIHREILQLQGFTGVADRREYNVVRIAYFYRRRKEYLHCIFVNNLPAYQAISGTDGVEHDLRKKGIRLSGPARGQDKADILIGAE